MKYDDIDPTFRNAIGVHEIFRRRGYASADIFVHRNPDGEMLVVLKKDGRQFNVTVGRVPMNQAGFAAAWTTLGEALNRREISDADFQRCVAECPAARDAVGFSIAMLSKGFPGGKAS